MSYQAGLADEGIGLSEAEVRERVASGQTNAAGTALTTRSIPEILRANAFNSINLVLLALGTALVVMGRTRDGVINLGFIVAIVAIGSFQEIRAKRRLDRITILATPRITVRRGGHDNSGADTVVSPDEIVLDDILVVGPGEQIVVDSTLVGGGPLTVNESLLTGESEPVTKRIGDELHSGTFCISGAAIGRVVRVGEDSLATSLTATARQARATKTPLQRLVDDVLRVLIVAAGFFGLLFVAQGIVSETSAVRVVEMATVTAAIIPVGLFLIFVVTYSMSAARLSRHDLLVQQLNALESLSHVDVVCSDKTGTLTANRLQLVDVEVVAAANDRQAVDQALSTFAHSATATNATTDALRAAFPGNATDLTDEVPFESANRFSAVAFGGTCFALGAPEALEPYLIVGLDTDGDHKIRDRIESWTTSGRRVLLFAGEPDVDSLHDLHDTNGQLALPPLEPLAVLGFADELRDGASDTVRGLLNDGVALKIISGDNPDTVAALARQVGLGDDLVVVSGTDIGDLSESEFAATAAQTDVFGRIAPHQKKRLVTALQAHGSHVAMVGDGVNDTLALTAADVGIAMESGSSAARGSADLVLLNDSFSALRPAINEGRRIVAGMRDILRLTIARSATLGLVAVAMMIINSVFPFSAGAQTIYGFITITIPTVGLALWARPSSNSAVDVAELARFVVPVALVNLLYGGAVFVSTYYATRHGLSLFDGRLDSVVGFTLGADEASAPEVAAILGRTNLIVFLILTGLMTILFLQPPTRFFATPSQPLHPDRRAAGLVVASIVLLVVIMTTGLRSWLHLAEIPEWGYLALVGTVAMWTVTLRAVLRRRFLFFGRI